MDVIVVLVENYSKEVRAVEFILQLLERLNPAHSGVRVGLVPTAQPSHPYLEDFTEDALRAALYSSAVADDIVDGIEQMRQHFMNNMRDGAEKIAVVINQNSNKRRLKMQLKNKVKQAANDNINIYSVGEYGELWNFDSVVQAYLLKDKPVDNIASIICTGTVYFIAPVFLRSLTTILFILTHTNAVHSPPSVQQL